jgi:hypothetical protein
MDLSYIIFIFYNIHAKLLFLYDMSRHQSEIWLYEVLCYEQNLQQVW